MLTEAEKDLLKEAQTTLDHVMSQHRILHATIPTPEEFDMLRPMGKRLELTCEEHDRTWSFWLRAYHNDPEVYAAVHVRSNERLSNGNFFDFRVFEVLAKIPNASRLRRLMTAVEGKRVFYPPLCFRFVGEAQ